MMPDFRDRWIVSIGMLYLAGIGQTYPGHEEKPVTGFVLTKIREHAKEFTGLTEAQNLANGLGGQVFKV